MGHPAGAKERQRCANASQRLRWTRKQRRTLPITSKDYHYNRRLIKTLCAPAGKLFPDARNNSAALCSIASRGNEIYSARRRLSSGASENTSAEEERLCLLRITLFQRFKQKTAQYLEITFLEVILDPGQTDVSAVCRHWVTFDPCALPLLSQFNLQRTLSRCLTSIFCSLQKCGQLKILRDTYFFIFYQSQF